MISYRALNSYNSWAGGCMTTSKILNGDMAILANHCLTIALLGRHLGNSKNSKREMMNVVDEAYNLFEDIMRERLAGEDIDSETHAAQRAAFMEALTYLVGVSFRAAQRLGPPNDGAEGKPH